MIVQGKVELAGQCPHNEPDAVHHSPPIRYTPNCQRIAWREGGDCFVNRMAEGLAASEAQVNISEAKPVGWV